MNFSPYLISGFKVERWNSPVTLDTAINSDVKAEFWSGMFLFITMNTRIEFSYEKKFLNNNQIKTEGPNPHQEIV